MQVIFYFIFHKNDYNLISIKILKLYHFISDILILINENICIEKKLLDSR